MALMSYEMGSAADFPHTAENGILMREGLLVKLL